MLRSRKVAVTGQPGSGKSAVCGFLGELGAKTVSSDEIAHQLLDPTTDCGRQVISLLGEKVVVEGQINRELIAEEVFKNPSLLKSLENHLHTRVLEEIEKRYQKSEAALFVAEVPLLYECGWESYFETVILVVSNRRTAFPEREWRFLPTREKAKKADIIIENNGSLEELKNKISKLITT